MKRPTQGCASAGDDFDAVGSGISGTTLTELGVPGPIITPPCTLRGPGTAQDGDRLLSTPLPDPAPARDVSPR